jgi:hypothetical protein
MFSSAVHNNSQTHPCPVFHRDRYIPDAVSGGRARNRAPPPSCARITGHGTLAALV